MLQNNKVLYAMVLNEEKFVENIETKVTHCIRKASVNIHFTNLKLYISVISKIV